jgi:diguanylate cyclase (GGDEF)-like protein
MPETSTPDRQRAPAELPDTPARGDQPARGDRPPHGDKLRGALLDSRQRWRDLVLMTADLAFETDEWGRFVFVVPDPTLGWSATALVGQPAEQLLADGADGAGFNPFRPTAPLRRRRAWLRRGDGGVASVTFSAIPLIDAGGCMVGARGMGLDVTDYDGREAQVAAALRRGEVLDHIIWRMGREVLAPRMMHAALDALVNALGAEGAAVVTLAATDKVAALAHEVGHGAAMLLTDISDNLRSDPAGPESLNADDGRLVLVASCHTRFDERAGLSVWRAATARPWDNEDQLLLAAAANTIRFVLEHEAIQREMSRQARTDPLTGLLNRRAFMEEIERCADRLDREELPGTLMFADLDNFKRVNDCLGHEMGDLVLLHTTTLLRNVVRPTDLVARLGGDEFALWLNGADHMTAAERAEQLRTQVPRELREVVGGDGPPIGVSIGIATREPGSHESIAKVIRRADVAMYEVKRNGRGHWRVALEEPR